jgi:mitogen-activated protein kinase 15
MLPACAGDPEALDPQILGRYEIVRKIGQGAYGVVWEVRDRLSGRAYALKKALNAFRSAGSAQRAYREISYLRALRGFPYVVSLEAVHRAENDRDLYLVFALMDSDLHGVIRAGILLPVHRAFIFWQLLCALKYLHSARLVHRDLKPSNILVGGSAAVRLCDFGLSRTCGAPADANPADYVATRWYRPPEAVLGAAPCSPAVDLWAAGCVLAEMMSGRPLFPGASAMAQLERNVAFTGPPAPADVAAVGAPRAAGMVAALTYCHPRADLAGIADDAADLIRKLLVFDANRRLPAEQCLLHPFVAAFHSPARERAAPGIISLALPDSQKFTVRDYRNQTYRDAVTSPDIAVRRS